MKHSAFSLFSILYSLFSILFSLSSCVDIDEYDNSKQGNFEALWKIIDEHYCFFDYKQKEYGLDWNAVYNKYKVRVDDKMNNEQLFDVLGDMLAELRDGHVNLSASHDMGRYWEWYENHPTNSADTLYRRYLGTDYNIAAGIKYRVLDDNIGYIRYESFNKAIGNGNLSDVLSKLLFCRGLIIDIRDNSGGLMTYADLFAARFFDEETVVGYIQHKTGPGHNDFSEMEEQRIKPYDGLRWHKPVCVLTNRRVYSAANEFVKYMSVLPNVQIVGDKTGGGAGLPQSNSLPNGWKVRFSSCPMYDINKNSTEFGIEPDHKVDLKSEDTARGYDTIIEFARALI